MSATAAEKLALVTNAASLAARECTGLIRRLEQSDDLIALRNALPNLVTSLLDLYGISHSLGAALENLELLLPAKPHLRRQWASDYYYLRVCARALEEIRRGARVVPGFEAGSHDDGQETAAVNGDSPAIKPLTPWRVQRFLLDLARLKGRLRSGISALDLYSLHCAISQVESIEDTSQNGSLSTAHPSHASDATSLTDFTHPSVPSLTCTKRDLEILNHPSENRPPFASYADETTKVRARNKTNPAYPRAATSWLTPLVNEEWDALREPVIRLFGLDRKPDEPGRANLSQWVLEYIRQTWPNQANSRGSGGQSLYEMAVSQGLHPELPALVIAAAFGLSELCREFPSEPESMASDAWCIVLLSALLGPSALLRASIDSMWERINEPPYSIDQRETIHVVLSRGFNTPDSRFTLKSPEPAPADYLAFLVSLRLRDDDLFFEVLRLFNRSSGQLKDLLRPGSFWAVASSQYEPCASDESRAYLSTVLSRLIETIFPAGDITHPLFTLFGGAVELAFELNLPFTSRDTKWYQPSIPDSRFAEDVRGVIRDENALAIVCLMQDPRWDPNLPYREGGSGHGSEGGTILHMAAEFSDSENFEVLELVVHSGADLERTDERNRTAIMLCEAPEPYRFLRQKGADTMHLDVDGRSIWHFAAANVDVSCMVWLLKEDPTSQQNLATVNGSGLTPLTEAIFYEGSDSTSAINSIVFLCAAADGNDGCLHAPSPVLHAAAKWGSEEVIAELIELGADPSALDSDGSSPLHHINFMASPGMIRLFFEACADLPIMRSSDQHTPIETLFLNYDPASARLKTPQSSLVLSSDVVTALLTPEIIDSRDNRGRGLWERFCCDVVEFWGKGLKQGNYHAFSVLRVALQQIARTRALRQYEEETNTSGISLFYRAAKRMTEGWPTDIIISVYKTLFAETTCLERFVSGAEVLDLAATGVAANAAPFLDLLLKNGVSVHQRPPLSNGGPAKRSLLEIACAPGNRTSASTFEKLLEYADPARLDDTDETNQGLIHHLIVPGPGRDQKLTALLDNGANPNLMRWGRSPALVSYILDRQHDAATILLDKGADPALATKDGMDAALAAASRGSIRMLEKVKSMVPPDFDWQRTCKSHFTIIHPGGGQITTTASNCNALHLAAFNGLDIIVKFYCANFDIDVNHAIVDNLHRPLHLAAIGGSAPCIRILHEYGADLTLKAEEGFTALHTAVKNSQMQAVKTLLEIGGASLNAIVDHESLTPFMHALRIGFPNIIKLFTDIGAFKVEASANAARSRFIGQAIDKAIRSGDLVQCKNLLSVTSLEDFETCPLRCDGCSPVMQAIREGKLAVLRWLLEVGCTGFVGACASHVRRKKDFTGVGAPPGYNALVSVCGNPAMNEGLSPLLSAYLKHGIDWTTAPVSPVHVAVWADNLAAVKAIMKHIRANGTMYRRRFCFEASSPRRTARSVSQAESNQMIRYVLNQPVTDPGSDVFAPGWTPLHVSTCKGHHAITHFLIAWGADVNAKDDAHDAPLHIAVKNGHETDVRILLAAGAHKARAHGSGFAPLMAAVERGDVGMAEALVDAGAETGLFNMDGMGLLNIAGESPKNPAVLHYLLGQGLDPYVRDKAGYMAFDDMVINSDMLGYALNWTFDFSRMVELNKGLFSLVIELNRQEGVSMVKRLAKRLPREKVAQMVNSVPARFVSPLCVAVHRDILGAIGVLVRFGADVNLEGALDGTPLMTACSRGRLESVRILVGLGAWVAYTRGDGVVRSAVDAARGFPEIQAWLLVGRYTERRALPQSPSGAAQEISPWSGIWTAAHRLQGSFAEHPRSLTESRLDYLCRAAEVREMMAGRVVRGAELVRPAGVIEDLGASVWDVEGGSGRRVAKGVLGSVRG